MSFPPLPLEIRARIYANLEDLSLAKELNEVFWAIAPRLFRQLVIGSSNERHTYTLPTELVKIHPNSGRFVEKLTLYPDADLDDTITAFLTQTPHFHKLSHLHIPFTRVRENYSTAATLPYRHLLERVIADSEKLTCISFNIQPCASLVDAGNTRLTRLDLGFYPSTGETVNITLPPTLEILSFHSWDSTHITGHTPSLRIVVIQKERVVGDYLADLGHLIGSCPLLTSVGFVDSGKFNFFRCSR
jgi:hypothetical protein